MKLSTAEVSFTHFREEGITTCIVLVKNKVFQGISRCSNGDNYCRNTGRKVAMSKAMSKTSKTITKIQRRNVWNAYRDMTLKPRW